MDLSGRKILVVDDVRTTRMMTVKMLEQLGGPAVVEAGDGEEALAALSDAGGVDFIVTDLEMPKLDGLAMVEKIRNGHGEIPRDLPVVVLTGNSSVAHVGSPLLLEVDAFLCKPPSKDALQKCLERLFKARERVTEVGPIVPEPETPSAPGRPEKPMLLTALPPGCVLSRDLLSNSGRLLLKANTRIGPRLSQRLRDLAALAGLPGAVWIYSL